MCNNCHNHLSGVGGVFQSLDELEFARGPWNAAVNGDSYKIERYLARGGEPNTRDSSGFSPLHYAARAGNFNICKMLLEYGASVDQVTKAGQATALQRAASKGYTGVVKLLLEYKADPRLVDSDGKTALHKAAEGNHADVCQLLVNAAPETRKVLDNHVKYPKDYVRCTDVEKETYRVLWWIQESKDTELN